jgi:AcrR family transcriptional regulator
LTTSRKEAKAETRQRLLDAALTVLDDEGDSALTTMRVTKLAGIAQSSFYVHFADVDDLLRQLVDDLLAARREETRQARAALRSGPLDEERLRATFRIPMQHSAAHPAVFRLLVRSRLDRTTPLGEWSRAVRDDNHRTLVADLLASGFPDDDDADRRRAEMVADGINALTETLTLGHLDGRYPDLEEAIDVLVAFSTGYFRLYRRRHSGDKTIGE